MCKRLLLTLAVVCVTALTGGVANATVGNRDSAKPALVPVNQMTFKLRGQEGDHPVDNGFRVTMRVVVYRVSHLANAPALPFSHRRPNACDNNQVGLGVIPVSVTLTNTTPNFPVPVKISPFAGSNRAYEGFDYLMIRTDAAGCRQSQSDPPLYKWDSIAPGRTGWVDFFIEIVGYYSPVHPKGNSAVLARTCIDFSPIIGGAGSTFPVMSPRISSSLATQGSCLS